MRYRTNMKPSSAPVFTSYTPELTRFPALRLRCGRSVLETVRRTASLVSQDASHTSYSASFCRNIAVEPSPNRATIREIEIDDRWSGATLS